jgi:hypothetical protein
MSAGGIKFATGRSAGFAPETTAKPRATALVILHADYPGCYLNAAVAI